MSGGPATHRDTSSALHGIQNAAMNPAPSSPGRLLAAVLFAVAGSAGAQVSKEAPPTQLVCQPSANLAVSVSRDSSGAPLGAGVQATSGTHECEVHTLGPALAQADGSWRFEWTDEIQGKARYRASVRRAADGYTLALDPARCGTLALPATATLSASDPACRSRVDRDAAFVQFWRQLRDAVARRDGELLQRLSLPQLLFSEGPDMVKAPAAVIRKAAPCLAGVTTADGDSDLGRLLQATDTPRLDMPPLSRRGEGRVSAGHAMTARWTPQGWRLEWFNADRATFTGCKDGGPTN